MSLDNLGAILSNAFSTRLSLAVKDFTITRVTNQGYSPSTGKTNKTTTVWSGRGIIEKTTYNDILEYQTNYTSIRIVCLSSDLSINPKVTDLINYNSNTYIIINVEKDPISITQTLVCRLAENGN